MDFLSLLRSLDEVDAAYLPLHLMAFLTDRSEISGAACGYSTDRG